MTEERGVTDESLMLLVRQLGQTQIEHAKTMRRMTEERQETMLLLADLRARLDPLQQLVTDMHVLRRDTDKHESALANHKQTLDELCVDVEDLQAAHNKRSGWEGFGGTLGKVAFGAILALVFGLLMQARAEARQDLQRIPPPTDTPATVDQPRKPCWAAPAGPPARELKV